MLGNIVDAVCMNPGLWIGQCGIFLELCGAIWIVKSAFQNKSKVKGVDNTWGGLNLKAVADTVRSQAITEFWAFLALGVGLLLQFIGALPIPRCGCLILRLGCSGFGIHREIVTLNGGLKPVHEQVDYLYCRVADEFNAVESKKRKVAQKLDLIQMLWSSHEEKMKKGERPRPPAAKER